MTHNTGQKKVVIIGLDGATFSLILPWVKEGKLPVLAKLIQDGAWGNLKSTIPTHTAPAWTSFMTGKNPGKHGIYHFLYHTGDNYDIRFANDLRRRGKSLWKILSELDKKVCVFNVPMTYPPEEVSGLMISGLTASTSRAWRWSSRGRGRTRARTRWRSSSRATRRCWNG